MRRSRFTAEVTKLGKTEKVVILAYSPENARESLVRQYGYEVHSVVRGDYRRPSMPSVAKWKHSGRLDEAKDFLGLRLPVQIKQTRHQGGRYGAYRLRFTPAGRPYHCITVKTWLDPVEAGRTLWHELCHAMQAERAAERRAGTPTLDRLSPTDWVEAWRTTPERRGSYRTRAIEVEARAFEDFNAECPLAAAR